MNLPFVLDVAIGLIFIYLILSLLASEIQELLATVLQWRAEHLKKSIEILLAGDARSAEEEKVIHLANQIYANPLVKNINQEAKGWLVTLPRKITWTIGYIYRSIRKPRPGTKKQETIFGRGKHSGPSYIPAETFATTLLDTLEIPTLVQKLTESRLAKFKDDRIEEIKNILEHIRRNTTSETESFWKIANDEFAELQEDFNQIISNFVRKKASLKTSINRMAESIDRYIDTFQNELPDNQLYSKAIRQMKRLKRDIFDDIEGAIVLGGLRPNVSEVVQSIQRGSAVYQEIEAAIQDKDSATYQKIQEVIDSLPASVVDSLSVLAKRAQSRVQTTEAGINQLRQEVEIGFDRAMDRASGVYKRNAKGVAILLGVFLAITANADTFHMVSRLSKDSALRTTITENAGQIIADNPQKNPDLETLKNQTDKALEDISLPIGWGAANLEKQIGWTPEGGGSIPIIKLMWRIPGWIVSGLAIAMGASFWFDLLGKIVNVRNAGKPPASSSQSSENLEYDSSATEG
jgi:uncharacterized protein YukE